jgi:hypothetical protein
MEKENKLQSALHPSAGESNYSGAAPKGNMFNRLWKTPEDLQKDIDKYFDDCEENNTPLTVTGLALALDTSRHTLLNYEHDLGKDFNAIIKKAKLMCENFAEQYLFSGKKVAGAIFNLKNNYGWIDKQQFEHSGGFMVDLIKKANESNKSGDSKPTGKDKK